MPTVDIYNADGKVVGNMDLNENVFGVDVRTDVMHEVVGHTEHENSYRSTRRRYQALETEGYRPRKTG